MSLCVSFWQISKSVQDKGGTSTSQQQSDEQTSTQQVPDDIFSYYEQMDKEEEEEEETQTVSFEIRQVVNWFLLQSVLLDPKRHYSWLFFKLTSCFSWYICSSIHYSNLFLLVLNIVATNNCWSLLNRSVSYFHSKNKLWYVALCMQLY